jgi:hypothetical protein
MIAVNRVTGALTNKPAFRNMPKVKAKEAELEADGEPVAATDVTPAGDVVAAGAPEGNKNAAGPHSDKALHFKNLAREASEKNNSEASSNHAESASEHATKSGDSAHESGDQKDHRDAMVAHYAAANAHLHAAKSNKGEKAKYHNSTAQAHDSLADIHRGHFLNETTKATDTTPALDAILARQTAQHEAMDKLAARVPATATRAAMATLYARLGANGQPR